MISAVCWGPRDWRYAMERCPARVIGAGRSGIRPLPFVDIIQMEKRLTQSAIKHLDTLHCRIMNLVRYI
jgi:hypothetical protein